MSGTIHTHHGMLEGLVDGCPRCAEHAEAPLYELDATQLRRLVALAADPKRLSRTDVSVLDLEAAAKVLTQMERCGKLFEIAADTMLTYLQTKWRIDFRGELWSFPGGPS
jgi:hypothetical protein